MAETYVSARNKNKDRWKCFGCAVTVQVLIEIGVTVQ
jgi:hypothetical protein